MVSSIVIAGPTASGKSAFAFALAKRMQAELICGDSHQIYAGMRIGTAGPTQQDMSCVPHHGFGTILPTEPFDAARFIQMADQSIQSIHKKNKIPIVVGGSGLYLRALRYGLADVPPSDPIIRADLLKEASEKGVFSLYERLQKVDPQSAYQILSADAVRIVRALEVFELTGKKPSDLRRSHFGKERLEAHWLLLWPEREWLIRRIEQRAHHMFHNGVIEEALRLRGVLDPQHLRLKTMGYKEALDYVDGHLSFEQAVAITIKRQKDYAKRQMTWFKKESWWIRIFLPCS